MSFKDLVLVKPWQSVMVEMKTRSLNVLSIYSSKWCIALQTYFYNGNNSPYILVSTLPQTTKFILSTILQHMINEMFFPHGNLYQSEESALKYAAFVCPETSFLFIGKSYPFFKKYLFLRTLLTIIYHENGNIKMLKSREVPG